MDSKQQVIILAVVIGLALVWLTLNLLRRRKNKSVAPDPRTDDIKGTVNRVKSWARGKGFACIAPAAITHNGITAQLDALVIGYFGVLGVKALGYTGRVYGSMEEDPWLFIDVSEKRHNFPNPMNEAAADVRLLRDVLFAGNLRRVPVEVACVFTNPRSDIAVPASAGYYTPKTFKEQLGKDRFLKDTLQGAKLELADVEKVLRAAMQQQQA